MAIPDRLGGRPDKNSIKSIVFIFFVTAKGRENERRSSGKLRQRR
jgi:hypothetical protein